MESSRVSDVHVCGEMNLDSMILFLQSGYSWTYIHDEHQDKLKLSYKRVEQHVVRFYLQSQKAGNWDHGPPVPERFGRDLARESHDNT